jgi:uncharacterized membrane protein
MSLASFLPVILIVHISFAVALLAPSLLLPFTTRSKEPGRISRRLLWLQSNGTLVIGTGLALTGILLIGALGTQLLAQPWLLLALVLYTANLLLAFFVQRPGVARLLTMRSETGDAAKLRLKRWATRQRYISYVMAGLVGAIGFLMMTKPPL